MPGAVPHTSTYGLTNATLPYVLSLAEHGVAATREDPALQMGLTTVDGQGHQRGGGRRPRCPGPPVWTPSLAAVTSGRGRGLADVVRTLSLESEEFLSLAGRRAGPVGQHPGRLPPGSAAYEAYLAGGATPLAEVTEGVVRGLRRRAASRRRAPASVARALVAVRSLHRFRLDEGMSGADPTGDVGVPRVPQGLPKALSEAEVERLLGAAAGDDAPARRDRAILELLYGTGIRISELVGLSLGDVDLAEGVARVYGKGAKERLVPVGRYRPRRPRGVAGSRRAERAVHRPDWARRGDSEAVFLNARGGRLSRQGAWGIVRRYADRVGLGDRLTPHVLRHSCATHMLDHGADIRVVQELLGHASITTTQVYTKVSTELLRSAYEAAHPRARRREADGSLM